MLKFERLLCMIPEVTRREIFCGFVLAFVPVALAVGFFFLLPSSILTVVVLFCVLFELFLTVFVMGRNKEKNLTDKLKNHYQRIEAFISLNTVIKPVRALPAMGGSAICPDLANILTSILLSDKPSVIVELGSGVSTIISCYCVQKNAVGHIWSLDHEEIYASITRRHLKTHGLEQYGTVLHAPLREYVVRGQKCFFYDLKSIEHIGMVDFLFVDGPPRTIDNWIRYATMPLMVDKLSPKAVVLLDDAARLAEREFIKLWQEQFPDFRCEQFDTEKGTAVFRRGS